MARGRSGQPRGRRYQFTLVALWVLLVWLQMLLRIAAFMQRRRST